MGSSRSAGTKRGKVARHRQRHAHDGALGGRVSALARLPIVMAMLMLILMSMLMAVTVPILMLTQVPVLMLTSMPMPVPVVMLRFMPMQMTMQFLTLLA